MLWCVMQSFYMFYNIYVILYSKKSHTNELGFTYFKALRSIQSRRLMYCMYCIDGAGVPESHDAHAFYCLYD